MSKAESKSGDFEFRYWNFKEMIAKAVGFFM